MAFYVYVGFHGRAAQLHEVMVPTLEEAVRETLVRWASDETVRSVKIIEGTEFVVDFKDQQTAVTEARKAQDCRRKDFLERKLYDELRAKYESEPLAKEVENPFNPDRYVMSADDCG